MILALKKWKICILTILPLLIILNSNSREKSIWKSENFILATNLFEKFWNSTQIWIGCPSKYLRAYPKSWGTRTLYSLQHLPFISPSFKRCFSYAVKFPHIYRVLLAWISLKKAFFERKFIPNFLTSNLLIHFQNVKS